MFEGLRERLAGAFARAKRAERVTSHDQIKNRAAGMSEGTHDIKVVATARVGNPLFDSLPGILDDAPPGTKAELILVFDPDEIKRDPQSLEAVRTLAEKAEIRNRTESGIFVEEEVDHLALELNGAPDSDNLSVFIQDPREKDRYWFRKVSIVSQGTTNRDGMEIPHVDMGKYDMGNLEKVPCPEIHLETAVNNFTEMERKIGGETDPQIRATSAVVGVARYTGQESLSLDAILDLTGLQYARIRSAHQQG